MLQDFLKRETQSGNRRTKGERHNVGHDECYHSFVRSHADGFCGKRAADMDIGVIPPPHISNENFR